MPNYYDNLKNTDIISFRRKLNNATSSAKKSKRPTNCLICNSSSNKFCNSSSNKFCNSHSIPARCLRAISDEGNVKTLNGLTKIPIIDIYKGVNNAGCFRLICQDCDNKVFKDYETLENYHASLDVKILHEIALKNYLKLYYKKTIELSAFPKLQKDLNIQNVLKKILENSERDKKDYFKEFCKTKKNFIKTIKHGELLQNLRI